ncbi:MULTISPECIES: methyl-accepting chemotaxis protein [Alteromonas]|jgi:methyl-accepting chemotaxis protein|uniref:methyl-accepting chemotaxis protein n=1 Tax=Alteromonas TaxID=226 RepID=UPI0007701507|nr:MULTISPECIES: methyl-accepting chemotaxis protein [Alteromonas]AMJ92103.1 chemotaxis protein [Alteromonas sp. Mac2]AMJ88247.1 chemotaxis protein [Alteromonas sp. Mac1]ANB21034.1 chemotaxis protein [Alteromonas stellipolaris]ANB25089.1 chemotaxis protein [Alteromonas stellipolaris]MBZ2163670.1 methyl-accepting chemotaxis protein [Alteromonas stellipolaris]
MLNTIKVRILTGYAGILLATLIAAVVLTLNNKQVTHQVDTFVSETLPALSTLDSVQSNSKQLVLIGYSLYGTTLSSNAFEEQKQVLVQNVDAGFNALGYMAGDTLKSQFNSLVSSMDSLQATMSASRVDWDRARDDLQLLNELASVFDNALIEVRNQVASKAGERSQAIGSQLQTSQFTIYLLVLILAAVAMAGFYSAKKQIAQPIEGMAEKLDSLAKSRNLVARLPEQSTHELCRMTNSIHGLVSVFQVGMKEVKGAVSGIEGAVNSLSMTTEQSSSSVDSLLTDITGLVNIMDSLESDMVESLQRSQTAANAAQDSAKQVDAGRVQVKETAEAISDLANDIEQTASMLETLQAEGNNVSSVVKTIAEIADQTNLLALNAAIEAARAGDSGRGFAVVADEVRTLAVRTHQSTVEINTMLEKIVVSITSAVSTMSSNQNKAHDSVGLANDLVSTLEAGTQSILALVSVSEEAAVLAKHSQSQANEAKNGVNQFKSLGDRLSQNNRQVNDAAEDLSALANGLSANVNQFKIG